MMSTFKLEFTEPEVDLIINALDVKKTEYIRMIERIVLDCRGQLPTLKSKEEEHTEVHEVGENTVSEVAAHLKEFREKSAAKKGGRPKGVKNKPK